MAAPVARPAFLQRGAQVLYAVGAVVFCVWLWGLVTWARKDGSFAIDLVGQRPHSTETHDLASYTYALRLEASSYANNAERGEHPLFAIDDRDFGFPWSPYDLDAAPRLELIYPESHDVEAVRVISDRASGSFQVICVLANGETKSYGATHGELTPLPGCTGMRRLRFRFPAVRKENGAAPLRIYELEARGK